MDDRVRRVFAGARADRFSADPVAEALRFLRLERQFALVAERYAPEHRALMLRLIDEETRRLQTPLVFREPRSGEFLIGYLGSEQLICTSRGGLTPARLAIANRHSGPETVRAADFAEPGAKFAPNAVRNSIKAAAEWIEHEVGCRPLASALRAIKVERGIVRYRAPRGAVEILT